MNMTNIMRSLKLFNFYSKFFLMLSKKKKKRNIQDKFNTKVSIKVSILELRKMLKKCLKSQKAVKGKYKR